MTGTPQAWYPYRGEYDGKYPPFSDLAGVPWYEQLKKDIPAIREQLGLFLDTEGVNVRTFFRTDRVNGDKGWWGGVAFLFWKKRFEKNINKGSSLFAYFKDIPGMVSLSVSILKPQTKIKGHIGDTDAIYRVHVPIYIPAGLPDCGITVAGITRPWRNDEPLVFCDAYFHEAWNMTNEQRVVMILDVIREEFVPQTKDICATVMSSQRFQMLAGKLTFLKKVVAWSPLWLRNIVRAVFKL